MPTPSYQHLLPTAFAASYGEAFDTFVKTGEAPDSFLEALVEHEELRTAVDRAFELQVEALDPSVETQAVSVLQQVKARDDGAEVLRKAAVRTGSLDMLKTL